MVQNSKGTQECSKEELVPTPPLQYLANLPGATRFTFLVYSSRSAEHGQANMYLHCPSKSTYQHISYILHI